jgi:hypothetical protein
MLTSVKISILVQNLTHMKKTTLFKSLFLSGFISVSLISCVDEPPPTKTLMQGNWELTEAKDAGGDDIKDKIAFPVTVMQLTDDNGMVGTIGPMFMYLVYGGSKWVTASAKIDQLFDYANLRFNTGEFFVASGNVEEFTVEGKLQATALAGGLSDLLSIFGVGNGYFQQTIYHKFLHVTVSFPNADAKNKTSDGEYDTMVWEFTDATEGQYNYKDPSGNYVLWGGWPVDKFTRATFTFQKKTEGINDIVKAHI